MSDHLPECPVPAMEARHGPLHPEDAEVNCICEVLHACEERVTEKWESLRGWGESYAYKTGSDNGFDVGYDAGLDAAREAVAAIRHAPDCRALCPCCMGDYDCNCERYEALAAIDALRTGQEAEPQGHEQQPQAHHPRQESTP